MNRPKPFVEEHIWSVITFVGQMLNQERIEYIRTLHSIGYDVVAGNGKVFTELRNLPDISDGSRWYSQCISYYTETTNVLLIAHDLKLFVFVGAEEIETKKEAKKLILNVFHKNRLNYRK